MSVARKESIHFSFEAKMEKHRLNQQQAWVIHKLIQGKLPLNIQYLLHKIYKMFCPIFKQQILGENPLNAHHSKRPSQLFAEKIKIVNFWIFGFFVAQKFRYGIFVSNHATVVTKYITGIYYELPKCTCLWSYLSKIPT